MTIVERKEDDLLNAPTVVGVWKHPDLLRTYAVGEERGQSTGALAVHTDNVVYSDDETYEQKQVPDLMPNAKKKQLVGTHSEIKTEHRESEDFLLEIESTHSSE